MSKNKKSFCKQSDLKFSDKDDLMYPFEQWGTLQLSNVSGSDELLSVSIEYISLYVNRENATKMRDYLNRALGEGDE